MFDCTKAKSVGEIEVSTNLTKKCSIKLKLLISPFYLSIIISTN